MSFGNTEGCGFKFGVAFLNGIVSLYDLVTLPIYLLVQNPCRVRSLANKKRAIVESQDKESITFKSTEKTCNFHKELVNNNINTIVEAFVYCSKKFGDQQCLGTRKILSEDDEVQPNGRVFKKFQLGDYEWKSYRQVNTMALNFGKGLREMGAQPKDNVIVFAETRAEWMIAAHGLFKQSFTLVTVYATLGEDAVAHAINETDSKIVITSFDLLPKFKKILQMTPQVKTVVYMEDQLKVLGDPKDISETVEIITFNGVVAKGEKCVIGECSPASSDTAIIMYTSGSTGVPKGVILLHKNLISTFKGFCDSTKMKPKDTMLGLLPLAHVLELLVENVIIFMGVRIGYSNALTMLDSSSKIKKGCKGDATVLRPTFITSVPLILDRIAKVLQEKVSKASWLARLVFYWAFRYKLRWFKLGFSTPILDRLIFGSVRKIIGGNVRLIVAGGAPLSAETHELIRTCFCLVLSQGYGLTETTSCASVQDEFDTTFGRVGAPMTSSSLQLQNWEEGNYTVTDKPYPRGEIVLGGDTISAGYYKLADKTNEDFYDADGKRWFKTGDIGEVHSDGVLKIIDRKKDLVKLQMGEYISLGKVESILKTHPLIENICIYGDSSENYCVGLVSIDKDKLKQFAERKGETNQIFEELCEDPVINKAILQELADYGKKAKLEKYEIPGAITIVKEVWTPESGLVTTTFKLKRLEIQKKYKDVLKAMYTK